MHWNQSLVRSCSIHTYTQGTFKSVSAFAPISHPSVVPWGLKAFAGYLGEADKEAAAWKEYDATLLMEARGPFPFKILLDQGTEDKFLAGQSRCLLACRHT